MAASLHLNLNMIMIIIHPDTLYCIPALTTPELSLILLNICVLLIANLNHDMTPIQLKRNNGAYSKQAMVISMAHLLKHIWIICCYRPAMNEESVVNEGTNAYLDRQIPKSLSSPTAKVELHTVDKYSLCLGPMNTSQNG